MSVRSLFKEGRLHVSMDLDEVCSNLFPFSVVGVHDFEHPSVSSLRRYVLTLHVPGWFLHLFAQEKGTTAADVVWDYANSKTLERLTGDAKGLDVFQSLVDDRSTTAEFVEAEGGKMLVVVGSYKKR